MVLSWQFNPVNESVLEVGAAILISIVGISLLNFFSGVEEPFKVGIDSIFDIHHGDIFGIEHTYSNLKLLWWLLADVPYLGLVLNGHLSWIDLNPKLHNTLADRTGLVVDLSIFNWFMIQ